MAIIKKFILVFILVLVSQVTIADTVAWVNFMRGDATVTNVDGTNPLRIGASIKEKDIIETSDKSMVQLIFTDKQMFYVKANSTLKIEDFHFNDENSSSATELIKGSMRSISGLVGRNAPTNVKYKAGETTIGIRGTAIEIDYDPNLNTIVSFDYGSGYVEVERVDLCIKNQMLRGSQLIIGNKVRERLLVRPDMDPSIVAQHLVQMFSPDKMDAAKELAEEMEFEDVMFTIAMLKEIPQFTEQDLFNILTGFGQSVDSKNVVPLLMGTTMLYPENVTVILQASSASGQSMSTSLRGVTCGLADAPKELVRELTIASMGLGATKEDAVQAMDDIKSIGCR